MKKNSDIKPGILFSLGTDDYMNSEIIADISESLGISNVKVIVGRDHEKENYQNKFDIVMRTDCVNGDFSSYSADIEPLTDEIIEALAEYSLEIISMWQRFEDFYAFQMEKSMEHHINVYLSNLCYWNSVFKNGNIKYVVLTNVPHEGYDAVIYYLVKKVYTDVKIMLRYVSRIPGREVAFHDLSDLIYSKTLSCSEEEFASSSKEMREYYERLNVSSKECINGSVPGPNTKKAWLKKRFGEKSFLKAFFNIHMGNYFNPVINPINPKRSKFKFFLLLPRSIVDFSHNIPKVKYAKLQHRKTERFVEYYESLTKVKCDEDIPSQPYVFFAMHYQPEATSLPLGGGMYTHQEIPIEILAAAIPEGWKVLVKKHPGQLSQCANEKIYEQLAKNEKIMLCSDLVSSHRLMENSRMVSTLTGTVAMEALFLMKEALIFGYSELISAPNAIRVRTVEDVQAAIKRSEETMLNYSEIDIKNYFYTLDHVSYPVNPKNYAENIKKYFEKVENE